MHSPETSWSESPTGNQRTRRKEGLVQTCRLSSTVARVIEVKVGDRRPRWAPSSAQVEMPHSSSRSTMGLGSPTPCGARCLVEVSWSHQIRDIVGRGQQSKILHNILTLSLSPSPAPATCSVCLLRENCLCWSPTSIA